MTLRDSDQVPIWTILMAQFDSFPMNDFFDLSDDETSEPGRANFPEQRSIGGVKDISTKYSRAIQMEAYQQAGNITIARGFRELSKQ